MQKLCILTDNSVQYTNDNFPGNDLVKIIPFSHLGLDQEVIRKKAGGKLSAKDHQVKDLLIDLRGDYHEILFITLSDALSDLPLQIRKVIGYLGNPANICIFNSRTTSIGLGLLVEQVAYLASHGASSKVIRQQLRDSIPGIYTLLYLPDLYNLADANFLSHAQAVVGSMLEFHPIYSLDDDCLLPIRKVRTQRHFVETFQEFLDEFNEPEYVAVVAADINHQKPISEFVGSHFSNNDWKEYEMSPVLTELFGSNAVALFVSEVRMKQMENLAHQ